MLDIYLIVISDGPMWCRRDKNEHET